MTVSIQERAPDFKAQAVVDGEIKEVQLADYRGKYVVLFFYPLDFTFVCPTEIVSFSDRVGEFAKRGAEVVAVSVDSAYSHLAWTKMARCDGGLGDVEFPLVADITKSISRDYGVLIERDGIALRGLFIIDRAGLVRHMLINDLPIGRSVDEALRVLDALQFVEKHGEVCPANWKPGAATIKPDPKGAREFFEKLAS